MANIKVFENKKIRTAWDADIEEWYFSVVDVCGVLSDQPTQRGAMLYWGKLKQRLKAETGNDRLNEIADPEKAILRGAEFYRKKRRLNNASVTLLLVLPGKCYSKLCPK